MKLEVLPSWLRTILPYLLAVVAGVVFVWLYQTWWAEEADEDAKARLELLEEQLPQLEADKKAAEMALDQAVASSRETIQALQQANERTTRQLANLASRDREITQQRAAIIDRSTQERATLASLPDAEIAARAERMLAERFPELSPRISPVVAAEPYQFVANRDAIQATVDLAIDSSAKDQVIDTLEKQLDINRAAASHSAEIARANLEMAESYRSQFEASEKARQTAAALHENSLARLEAQTDRVKALERKLFWRRWEGIAIAAGTGVAAYYIGRETAGNRQP